MAHFAKIENGVVRDIIVVSNNDCDGGNFPASESVGQAFIASIGFTGEWKQTSYSGSFRSKYAGIGDLYDPALDIFVTPPVVEEKDESI
jgi:hypothetical protein